MPAQYNPHTGEISTGSTVYEHFHEYAHLHQHSQGTALWRLRELFFHIPVANRLANLAVEIEAALIARNEMKACGIWQICDGVEALRGIRSYL